MSAIENPPAFPNDIEIPHPGMTLRDWFAGQALAGMMGNESTPFSADVAEVEPRQIAEACYDLADAMLAARSTFNDADNRREEG